MSFKKLPGILFIGIGLYSASAYSSEIGVNSYSSVFKQILQTIFTDQNYILDITKNLKSSKEYRVQYLDPYLNKLKELSQIDFNKEREQYLNKLTELSQIDFNKETEKKILFDDLQFDRSIMKFVVYLKRAYCFIALLSFSPQILKSFKILYYKLYKIYLYHLFINKVKLNDNSIKSFNMFMRSHNIFNKIHLKSFPIIIKAYIDNLAKIHEWYIKEMEESDSKINLLKNAISRDLNGILEPDGVIHPGFIFTACRVLCICLTKVMNLVNYFYYKDKIIPQEFYR